MNTTEIDIDRIVDYASEYSAVIKKGKITNDEMIGLCPFHDDSKNSFSVNLKTGQWYCFAEGQGGNFVQFYSKTNGVTTKEAYKQILEKYGVKKEERNMASKTKKSYSLSEYSKEKKLPEEWLSEEWCLSTAQDRDGTTYLKIPYYSVERKEVTFRKRYAGKEFRWKYGSSGKIELYGEWRLNDIQNAGYVTLIEGESDSQSMWYMGISALGVPGASMFKSHMTEMLQNLRIYIHREPDQGGETFVRKIINGLREGEFKGKVYCFSCSEINGLKDPSDIYKKYGKKEGAKIIRNLIEHAELVNVNEPEKVPEVIPGAPINLRTPEGWRYSDKGIFYIDEKTYVPILICRTPIIITRRLAALDSGEEKIEVAFKRDGKWITGMYTRSTIFTARTIMVLSDFGCTVTSENAKMVVKFLSALEASNIDIIPKVDATSTFGWQPGNRFIPGYDNEIILDIDPSQRRMATAYCQYGEMSEWIAMMRKHRERNKFRFILAASFAAPLLRIINQRIFFVYNWGGSKGGKTAALKAALSAWGDPNRLMFNFNATQVGLERTASFYCDLPLGIDERQLAGRNQENIEKIIYMIASGTGRIRGNKSGGLQTTHQWRTIALSTGEEPISTESSQTGVSTRILELYGGPFDDEKEASLMHQQTAMNYGWAGPEFIRKIVTIHEKDICDKFDEMEKNISTITGGEVGSHIAGISVVALADAMIDTWFFADKIGEDGSGNASLVISESSWERAKEMATAIAREQLTSDVSDVNENAVQFIVDWVTSNNNYFGTNSTGKYYGEFTSNKEEVYILPSALNEALKAAGFSPRKTMKYLADNDFIEVREKSGAGGKSYQVLKRFNGPPQRAIHFYIKKVIDNEEIDRTSTRKNMKKEDVEFKQENFVTKDGFVRVPDDEDLPF